MTATTHDLTQGTPAWHAHRNKHYNASEAPTIMRASPWQSYEELLFEKKTGIAREVGEQLQRVFDRGHQIEALARPILEEKLGEDLYSETVSAEIEGLPLSASLDGCTLDDETIAEIKQWNQADAAQYLETGELLPKHYWQVEQQLLVKGAKRCIFVMTDGTPDNWVEITYTPRKGRAKQLIDGWKQFHEDLQTYEPEEITALKVVAYEPPKLPAIDIQVTSAIQRSNFDAFAARAVAFLDSINTELETDQDFADAEANVKACKKAEAAIAEAKDRITAGSIEVAELVEMIDNLGERIRRTRLDLDKSVKSEKERRKYELVSAAQAELDAFAAEHEEDLHGLKLATDGENFGTAIKGLKTITSIKAKLAEALHQKQEVVRRLAIRAEENWAAIPEGYAHLFVDWPQVGLKDPQDFINLVNSRISAEAERQNAAAAAQARQSDEIADSGTPDTPETPTAQNTASPANFDEWWETVGSGVVPAPGEDQEAHCRRVARLAWKAAVDRVPF